MPILVVGLSHREAPVELRERLAISGAHLDQAVDRLYEFVPEGVMLSTCNRFEVYASVGHRGSGVRSLTRYLADVSGVDEHELADHVFSYWQEDAVRHLFRVAAGLDSMILGEGQILGQVREAYEQANRRRPIGAVLARLFERALVVGKRARTETAIARNAVSVSQAAVELARRVIGPIEQATVLVIGAGKMGELAARALWHAGATRILVANRTAARADRLVEQFAGTALPWSDLSSALETADVVISSTSSEDYVITADQLAAVMRRRAGRRMVLVDIAVPRDVEPLAGELAGVHLFNVDDLRDLCASSLAQRQQEAEKIDAIVDQELDAYVRWFQAREVAPTIGALVQHAESIRQDEMARALARLGSLSERDRNTVNALTIAIVNKMLHGPITRLKERSAGLDRRHYVHAVRELFDLPDSEPRLD